MAVRKVSKGVTGFYELGNIKIETIINGIKDIPLRCHFCRYTIALTHDGVKNMMGKRSLVSTQTLAEKPKAIATNCQGHSLSLAIKSLTNHSLTKGCTIIHDVTGTVGEICVLVKYSPKL